MVHGLRLLERKDGGGLWCSWPDQPWDDATGKRRYSPVVKPSRTIKDEVERAVLKAWEGRGNGNSLPSTH